LVRKIFSNNIDQKPALRQAKGDFFAKKNPSLSEQKVNCIFKKKLYRLSFKITDGGFFITDQNKEGHKN
jgi:hypothetical protein